MKVFLIILELICLTVMGFFMMKLQTSLSLKSYRLDMEKEIQEMDRLLADRKEEEAQTIATDNAIYQSKAESIAFMANHEDGFEATDAKMREYADLLDVDNVLIVDREGKQLAKAADTEADFTYERYNQLRTVFTTGEPSEPYVLHLQSEL